MDYTKIIEALILLLVSLADAFLIPFLRSKIKTNKRNELIEYTTIGVKAAEQIFGSKQGIEKKAYVINYLNNKGIKFDVDTVNNIIESAVLELTKEFTKE